MQNTQRDLIISNLDCRVDRALLGEDAPDLWRTIPYTTEEFSGVMLGTGGSANIRHIEINLGATGSYRMWIGVYSFQSASRLRLRLTGDPCCETLPPTPELERISNPVIHEMMWREVDLTDKTLILEGGHIPHYYPAALAYIRLERVHQVSVPPKARIAHPMAITEDGFGIFHEIIHNNPEDLVEPLHAIPENSCMKILIWGAADGDICIYPTKAGTRRGSAETNLTRHADSTYFANLRMWKDNGWDPMVTVKNYCRKRGWEFHAYVRVEAFATHYPLTLTCGLRSQFFEENQHLCCRDKNGQKVMRLSYAHEKVQEHMLEVFREIIDYEPDGLCLAFIRGVPLLLYEDVMVEGFKTRHGEDPRKLDEYDTRWLRYQAEVITDFMEKVKSLLKPGQRLSALIPGNMADCERWGLDPARWVAEGIVDDLYPTGQKFTPEDVHIDDPYNLDFQAFRSLQGSDDFRLIPMLYPWSLFGNDYEAWRELIKEFLDSDADGYAVWDGNASDDRLSKIVDIGLAPRKTSDTPLTEPSETHKTTTRRILTMDGYRFDRYHHFEIV